MIRTIAKEVEKAVHLAYGVTTTGQLQIAPPPKAEFGDFAVTVFPIQDLCNEQPVIIARKVAERISLNGLISKVSAVGPYINITLGTHLFEKACSGITPSVKNGKTVMVEYLSPNTNKPLHLGHLRNGVLGMAISNILEHTGHTVVKANLVNDRGIHICKSMLAWQKLGNGETPETSGLKGDFLVGKYYVKYGNLLKEEIAEQLAIFTSGNPDVLDENIRVRARVLLDKARTQTDATKKKELDEELDKLIGTQVPIVKEAKEMLLKWEAGDPDIIALWKTMNTWVYAGFDETYKRAGLSFDVFMYESETYKLGKDIISDGMERGVFTATDGGAIVFELPKETFGDNIDGSIKKVTVLRGDGTSVYMTQDIGTAIVKATKHNLNSSIYVVGSEQEHHFKCLFEILRKLGYAWSKDCYHLSYGMVKLPNGKMKSREGTSVDADNLMEEMKTLATKEIMARGGDVLSKDEVSLRAETIAQGAVKFYLAKASPRNDIRFDPKESISFDGTTGPYCQYAYARISSILGKAPAKWKDPPCANLEKLGGNQEERVLAQKLVLFGSKFDRAMEDLNPSVIAAAVFEVAKAFNQWYNKNQIIDTKQVDLSKARIALAQATANALKTGLGLLGINVLTKM